MGEWFFYILIVLILVALVWGWHVYGDRIRSFLKTGPVQIEQESLAAIADKMHSAKADFQKHAAVLENRLTTAKADVEATTAKVVAAAAPKAVS